MSVGTFLGRPHGTDDDYERASAHVMQQTGLCIEVDRAPLGLRRCLMAVHSTKRAAISIDLAAVNIGWVAAYAELLRVYLAAGAPVLGAINATLDDAGIGPPGLAGSECRPGYFLIPDPMFIIRNAYALERGIFAQQAIPWGKRRAVAFWRGTTTGHVEDLEIGWRSMQRIRMCNVCGPFPDIFDVGLVSVAQRSAEERAEMQAVLPIFPRVPESEFDRYKLHIDVDGNVNSWPGLFIKLLTGSPVLKVASPFGWRQWYYDRLIPWANFIPIERDLSDLHEKTEWLLAHDNIAQQIGLAGKALADSMALETELIRAVPTIAAAISAASSENFMTHLANEHPLPPLVWYRPAPRRTVVNTLPS